MKDIDSLEAAGKKAIGLMNDYLFFLKEKKNRSAMTLDFYSKDIHQFAGFIADSRNCRELLSGANQSPAQQPKLDAHIFDLDQQKAQCYVDEFLVPNYSPATITRKITAVRGLYHYLKQTQRIDQDPFANIVIPSRDNSTDIEYLEATQLQQLFDAISGDSWLVLRDRAIVALLYCTGIRVSELLSITINDFDSDKGTVQVLTSRNSMRRCQLPAWVVDLIKQYMDARLQQCLASQKQPSLFINCDSGSLNARSIRRKLKQYSRRAGLSVEATPATLRHTCAMHMLLNGADVKTVRGTLGHMSASSIRPYLKRLHEIQKSCDSVLKLVESAVL